MTNNGEAEITKELTRQRAPLVGSGEVLLHLGELRGNFKEGLDVNALVARAVDVVDTLLVND